MPADGSTAKSSDGGFAVANATLILRLKNWSINPVVSESVWGDSDSAGFTNRARAREDCTGSMTGVIDTSLEIWDMFEQGDIIVPLVLWQSNVPPDYWYFGRALITSFNLTMDMDTKEVMEWSADFGSDGRFYYPGESGAPSAVIP